jgi:hypothetical protein
VITTHLVRSSAVFLAALALLSAGALLSCGSTNPEDQVLDRLEQAVGALEATVSAARPAAGERLGAGMAERLGADGARVQAAYAELRVMADDQLSDEQSKRRAALNGRAVNAVADMLNLRLDDEKK